MASCLSLFAFGPSLGWGSGEVDTATLAEEAAAFPFEGRVCLSNFAFTG